MPYDPKLSVADQVHTSVKSSLQNLRYLSESGETDTCLDSLVLHSPLPTMTQTLEAWRAAETYVPHKIRHLGISNVFPDQLEHIYHSARMKPAVVQNRFYADNLFDSRVRRFCADNGIVYQSFWTLSANPTLLRSSEVGSIAKLVGLTAFEAVYCLVLALGDITILNGTKDEHHMLGDLAAIAKTREWASKNTKAWYEHIKAFRSLIGED